MLDEMIQKNTSKTKVALKSLELFFHTLWRTILNLGPAWPADVCTA